MTSFFEDWLYLEINNKIYVTKNISTIHKADFVTYQTILNVLLENTSIKYKVKDGEDLTGNLSIIFCFDFDFNNNLYFKFLEKMEDNY